MELVTIAFIIMCIMALNLVWQVYADSELIDNKKILNHWVDACAEKDKCLTGFKDYNQELFDQTVNQKMIIVQQLATISQLRKQKKK